MHRPVKGYEPSMGAMSTLPAASTNRVELFRRPSEGRAWIRQDVEQTHIWPPRSELNRDNKLRRLVRGIRHDGELAPGKCGSWVPLSTFLSAAGDSAALSVGFEPTSCCLEDSCLIHQDESMRRSLSTAGAFGNPSTCVDALWDFGVGRESRTPIFACPVRTPGHQPLGHTQQSRERESNSRASVLQTATLPFGHLDMEQAARIALVHSVIGNHTPALAGCLHRAERRTRTDI